MMMVEAHISHKSSNKAEKSKTKFNKITQNQHRKHIKERESILSLDIKNSFQVGIKPINKIFFLPHIRFIISRMNWWWQGWLEMEIFHPITTKLTYIVFRNSGGREGLLCLENICLTSINILRFPRVWIVFSSSACFLSKIHKFQFSWPLFLSFTFCILFRLSISLYEWNIEKPCWIHREKEREEIKLITLCNIEVLHQQQQLTMQPALCYTQFRLQSIIQDYISRCQRVKNHEIINYFLLYIFFPLFHSLNFKLHPARRRKMKHREISFHSGALMHLSWVNSTSISTFLTAIAVQCCYQLDESTKE